jgi:hypothetical protein
MAKRFFIIGAGTFGKKAALHLSKNPSNKVICVDIDPRLSPSQLPPGIGLVQKDGIQFLKEEFSNIKPDDFIIPAVPIHLAAYWLISYMETNLHITEVPQGYVSKIPNPIRLQDKSYAASYANFKCPDNCVEGSICPVTGQKRNEPLYQLLRSITVCNYNVHIIQSRQLGPGMGGYKKLELENLVEESNHFDNFMLGTACNCHGIITSIEKYH